MKTLTTAVFAGLMLFAVSCKKENTMIRYTSAADENITQTLLADNDGHSSRAVKIGTQILSRENLSVRYYRNGDKIPQEKDPVKWSKLKTGAWCWYNNDSATGHIYGRLYNYYAVNDPRGLAPEGWHIPDDEEWNILFTYLGKNAGGKMKSTGTIQDGTGLWSAPNKYGSNRSGFTGFPSGERDSGGYFSGISSFGNWWSSTNYAPDFASVFSLSFSSGGFPGLAGIPAVHGFSVRCIKD